MWVLLIVAGHEQKNAEIERTHFRYLDSPRSEAGLVLLSLIGSESEAGVEYQ